MRPSATHNEEVARGRGSVGRLFIANRDQNTLGPQLEEIVRRAPHDPHGIFRFMVDTESGSGWRTDSIAFVLHSLPWRKPSDLKPTR
jgi:hypothetical protein